MNYNDLNEGQQRLAAVKFEMAYPGNFPYGLVERTMERVNPRVFQTEDLMYLPPSEDVDVIMQTMIIVQQEADEMVKYAKKILSQ